MNPLEKQAHDARTFRIWAVEHGKPHFNVIADGLEKDLSRQLTASYEASRGTTRPSEDVPHELTREQKATIHQLAADYDAIAFDDKFLPDGTAVVECVNYRESDGAPELEAVVHIEPGGIPL